MVMPYQDTRNLYYNNAYGRQAQTLGYDPASPQPTGGAQYRPPPMNFGTSYQNPGGGNWATSALAQAQNPGLDYLGAASTATAQATAAAKAAADKAAADKAASDKAAAAAKATTAAQAAGTLGAPVPGTVGGPNPPAGPPGSMAAPATTAPTGTLPAWASSTSGRSGKSYAGFLAANPGFDPYTNLDAYVGAGGSQSPVLQQAFGWLNQWARGNGYQDGKNIPAAQRAQMFLAFVERARQGVMDRGENWAQDAASRLPDQGFSYQAGWGLTHGGQSYETQGPATGASTGTASSGGGAGSRTGPVATTTTATTATTPAAVPGGGTTVAGTGGHFDPTTGSWVPDAGTSTTGSSVPAGAYYAANPQVAVTNFLAQHGLSPDSHSPFADMLRKIGGGLAPVIAQTIGMGAGAGGAMDQLRDLPTMLSNLIYGNGGSTFGNIGGYAGNVMQNVLGTAGDTGKSYLSGMDPSAVENLLKTITGLRGLGMNQYMQNFQQNALQSGLDKYGAADLANQGQANAGDWLIQNDPYGLFRFATAGGGVGAGTGYGQRQ